MSHRGNKIAVLNWFIQGNYMKKYVLLGLCLCGNAMAEVDSLAPVIDNSSYPTTAPAPNLNAVPAPNALYEMMGRLDKLQAEVQQLTGKVEEQGNQIAELKKHQSAVSADFDERLQSIEKGTAPNLTAQPEPAAEIPTATPVASATPEPAAASAEPQAQAQATLPTPETPAPAPPAAIKQPEVQVTGDEKQTYQQAYNSLRTGHTDESITQFKTYLSQYPTGGYADMAYYWLGEAYRVKLDNDSARQTFNTVLEKYPSSTKVPETLLKLGTIEADQKNTVKAREYLMRVTTEFPNTPTAHSAEKKLSQLK